MAKFISNFDLDGTIRNQTYYKTRGQIFAKSKSGVSRDRIMSEDSFARTRENGTEFGNAAIAGKLLRQGFNTLVKTASDTLSVSRLTQAMTKVKNEDKDSIRGQRTVAIGITTAPGRAWLINYNFNRYAILKTILGKPYIWDVATGIITIDNLVPALDLRFPEGATHVTFTGAIGTLNFDKNAYDVSYSNIVNLPKNLVSTTVTLTPEALPTGTGELFLLLHIGFFQEVNALQYPLKNGGYNALAVIDVQ